MPQAKQRVFTIKQPTDVHTGGVRKRRKKGMSAAPPVGQLPGEEMPDDEGGGGKALAVQPVLEGLPKWELLREVLEEVQGERRKLREEGGGASAPETGELGCNSSRCKLVLRATICHPPFARCMMSLQASDRVPATAPNAMAVYRRPLCALHLPRQPRHSHLLQSHTAAPLCGPSMPLSTA